MLYLIEVTGKMGWNEWDRWDGWVVRAPSRDQALDSRISEDSYSTIREYLLYREDEYSIKPIEEDGPVQTILGSFNAR